MKYAIRMMTGLMTVVAMCCLLAGTAMPAAKSPQLPDPAVRDQVLHDRGNIGMTVQNYGLIGGFSWAGMPSGRWPSNSEHDYLAEMRFWIGGIDTSGTARVANTADDFNPLPNWAAAEYPTDILLSTDTTSYPYDPSDTIGLGFGFPAYGWQIYNPETGVWEYNQVFRSLSASYSPGGPVAVQESICRYGDDATGLPAMGIEVTQTVRQWNYSYNRNLMFFTIQITNASAMDYTDFAFGLYCDFDIGGTDPATGENGRLGDLVAYDTDLDLAWTYDQDNYDPGWGYDVQAGMMGTVILSSPGDVGMTSFNTDQWENLPTTDNARYAMISNTNFDSSLPPTDQFYVQGVAGFDLPAGETVQIDFALVAAYTEDGLADQAQLAKDLFAANYIAARPPDPSANIRVTEGDHSVTIYWDTTSEASIDPITETQDFRGYRIYRSDNLGGTWGNLVVNDDQSRGPGYVPRAEFELDGLGRVGHTFRDTGLVNGLEYWYAIAAYDSGSVELDLEELENDYLSGRPGGASNIIRAIPRDDAIEYISPEQSIAYDYTGTLTHIEAFDGLVSVIVVDENQLTGDDYRIAFSDDCVGPTWSLINLMLNDTILTAQDVYDEEYFSYPVVEGLQVVVNDGSRSAPSHMEQTGFAMPGVASLDYDAVEFADVYGCNANFRSDYEIRFTETGSTAYEYFNAWFYLAEVPITVPFEVWNTTTNTQVACFVVDWYNDGEWTLADEDYIVIAAADYNDGVSPLPTLPHSMTWLVALFATSTPATGDILSLDAAAVVTGEDSFEFSTSKTSSAQAEANMENIHVVPNPYLANARWEQDKGDRKLQFVDLPGKCTIRIYTLAGELIRTIEHTDGTGATNWNMTSESGRGIASGVYLYHVDSEYGNKIGKFAVIK